MMKIKMTGFDDRECSLRELADRAKQLEGTRSVPFRDLFTPAFIQKHTKHSSLEDWFAGSGFALESAEDFKAIPTQALDAYVQSTSDFSSWEEMMKAAGAEYYSSKLFG